MSWGLFLVAVLMTVAGMAAKGASVYMLSMNWTRPDSQDQHYPTNMVVILTCAGLVDVTFGVALMDLAT